MLKKMIEIAVIGCGYWGPNLIRNFRSLQECRVRKVCDSQRDRLDYIERLYADVETTTNFDVVIADSRINAVAIATPVFAHHTLALQALKSGKHTFIEKPMASSAEQCKEFQVASGMPCKKGL